MNQSNTCPQCGGKADHIITDIMGKRYYQCTRGLTSFRETWDEIAGSLMSRVSRIIPCDTFIHQGRVFSGAIAFMQGEKVKTMMVLNGKIQ